MQTRIYVIGQFVGYHRWNDAPTEVIFLRDYHRHVFHVKLSVNVSHGDRQVEFFILSRHLESYLRGWLHEQHFDKSCEQIAEEIIAAFVESGYSVHSCEVSEDLENGAVVTMTANE